MSVWHASRASTSASSSPTFATQPPRRRGRSGRTAAEPSAEPPAAAGGTRVVSAADVRLLRLLADQLADRRRLRLGHQVALVLVTRAVLRTLDTEQ